MCAYMPPTVTKLNSLKYDRMCVTDPPTFTVMLYGKSNYPTFQTQSNLSILLSSCECNIVVSYQDTLLNLGLHLQHCT